MKTMKKWKKNKLIKILLWVYTIVVVMVLVLKIPAGMDIWKPGRIRADMRLVPFKTIIDYVGNVQSITDWFFKNLMCNILMFMPYGLMLPFIIDKKKASIKCCIFGIVLSLLIEIIQYVLAIGIFDIDDIILNLFGVILGYIIYVILAIAKNKLNKKK